MNLTHAKTKVISDIEVLRAIAVIFVVCQHAMYFNGDGAPLGIDAYLGFWGGVDVFFAISGFVIAKGLIQLQGENCKDNLFWRSIVGFWIKRIWRIWPTAWLWAAIILLLSMVDRSQNYWGNPLSNVAEIAAIVTNTANMFFYFRECFLASPVCGHISLLPYWSLSLEEQFYVLLPFILFFVRGKWFPVFLILAIAVQFFIPRPAWSIFWVIRSDALFAGVLIAWSLGYPNIRGLFEPTFLRNAWVRPVVIISLLGLIMATAGGQSIPFATGIICLLAAILVWFASFDQNYVLAEGCLKNMFIWVGARSYAIYLIHFPSLYLAKRFLCYFLGNCDHFKSLPVFCGVMLALALADINYRVVEMPLRRKGAAIAKRFVSPKETLVGSR